MSDDLSAAITAGLAAHHLENLKTYGAKARECQLAGRDDLAALFRTQAIYSGRQWLSLVCPEAIAARHVHSPRAYAARTLMEAQAAGRHVVTNLDLVPAR